MCMVEAYFDQVDQDFNIRLPEDIVKRLKIKANDYFNIIVNEDNSIELFIVDDEDLIERFEGSLFLPE